MNPQDIERGTRVFWHDPDPIEGRNYWGHVTGWQGRENGHPPDDECVIDVAFDDGGCAEVFAHELRPPRGRYA